MCGLETPYLRTHIFATGTNYHMIYHDDDDDDCQQAIDPAELHEFWSRWDEAGYPLAIILRRAAALLCATISLSPACGGLTASSRAAEALSTAEVLIAWIERAMLDKCEYVHPHTLSE